MHLFDKSVGMAGSSAICGGAAPIATGHALTAKLQNKDYVTSVYFGDGASEEGSLWETLNFAALKKLPVVYFLENNFYSVCSPLDRRQPEGVEIYKKAQAFGVNATQVDGTNVLDCYAAAKTAIEKARSGEGPQFVEMRVYRWRAHGGSGDDLHLGYRNADEGKEWHNYCPIELYQKFLVERGLLTPGQREEMEKKIEAETKAAFEFARNAPNPEEKDLYTFVYAK
jgi:pyruvate dehydrogenase E1 component alpha subunit